jgi:hypothetical protein
LWGQEEPNDILLLHQQLREDLLAWKDLLEVSGGTLELSKCFYYIRSWKFDENGNAMPTTLEEQRKVCLPIRIPDSTGEIKISQEEVQAWNKTLGCYKTINGNEEEQAKQLTTRSDTVGYIVKKSWKDIHTTYNMIYMSSMTYSLPATLLSYESCDNIQKYAITQFLPAMGYEQSMPRAVVYGPADMGAEEYVTYILT